MRQVKLKGKTVEGSEDAHSDGNVAAAAASSDAGAAPGGDVMEGGDEYIGNTERSALIVICHTSQVTHRTSHVTRHTSHVTRHTSHVARHTSLR